MSQKRIYPQSKPAASRSHSSLCRKHDSRRTTEICVHQSCTMSSWTAILISIICRRRRIVMRFLPTKNSTNSKNLSSLTRLTKCSLMMNTRSFFEKNIRILNQRNLKDSFLVAILIKNWPPKQTRSFRRNQKRANISIKEWSLRLKVMYCLGGQVIWSSFRRLPDSSRPRSTLMPSSAALIQETQRNSVSTKCSLRPLTNSSWSTIKKMRSRANGMTILSLRLQTCRLPKCKSMSSTKKTSMTFQTSTHSKLRKSLTLPKRTGLRLNWKRLELHFMG